MNNVLELAMISILMLYILLNFMKDRREKKVLEMRVSNLETALNERRLIDQFFCKMLPAPSTTPSERKKPGPKPGSKRKIPSTTIVEGDQG